MPGPYGYALHAKANEDKITAKGLVCWYGISGSYIASPDGFFAKDRRVREPKMILEVLRGFVIKLFARGGSLQTIVATPASDRGFTYSAATDFATTDSPNLEKLTGATDGALSDYAALVGATGELKGQTLTQFRSNSGLIDGGNGTYTFTDVTPPVNPNRRSTAPVAQPILSATTLNALAGNAQHFLTRLATLSVRLQFDTEQLQTTTHVYMTKPNYVADRFTSYLKVGGSELKDMFVLRIDLTRLENDLKIKFEQDVSDQNAYRVKDRIPPEGLEKWVKASTDLKDVLLDEGWEALTKK